MIDDKINVRAALLHFSEICHVELGFFQSVTLQPLLPLSKYSTT